MIPEPTLLPAPGVGGRGKDAFPHPCLRKYFILAVFYCNRGWRDHMLETVSFFGHQTANGVLAVLGISVPF